MTMLQKLAYAYPYHQAVGFYLGRPGFPAVKGLAERGGR